MTDNRDPAARDLRIGIDVGGTNTDAVVVDTAGTVLAAVKRATTPDPIDGIRAALEAVLDGIEPGRVAKAMLGTTHPANAIIQRRDLDPVGVVRLAAPSSLGVRPGAAWPDDLRELVLRHAAIVHGGFEYNGVEIAPLDEEAVARFAAECGDRTAAIAVSCAFSPASVEHELRAAEIIARELGPAFPISLSHQVGSLGLLERENATVLNASLLTVARRVVDGFHAALAQCRLSVDSYLTQNDGTLMTADEAVRFPVLTVGSGPTNSMRGACALAGVSDGLVIDVGGTSADVGILVDGFPRESAAAVEVGGVRTNFRMPDLISIGLGGGTIVRTSTNGDAAVRVGPDSVGYDVVTRALAVGGDTTTLTDISLRGGRMKGFGDTALLADLPDAVVDAALDWVDEQITLLCERLKTSSAPIPLLAVGGGAHLVPDVVGGISEVIRPRHHALANAFGAAIAEASGTVDRVYSYETAGREACLDEAKGLASDAAVRAGAHPDHVRITTVSEIPMTYVPGGGCRVVVKAAGPLAE